MPNLAKIVRSLPPEKLNQLLDVDVWRAPAAGADAVFDAERFGDWLHALIEDGVEAGAQTLTDLDFQVVIAGFSRHVAVFDHAAVSSYVTLDGELVEGREPEGKARADVGGYVVLARRTSAWDTIVDLLAELASSQSTYFHRLMRECVDLSNGAREADGFHSLMDDDDQAMFDLSVERDTRREEQGYVSPADARRFSRPRDTHRSGARPRSSRRSSARRLRSTSACGRISHRSRTARASSRFSPIR
jgi:hypothetical protein